MNKKYQTSIPRIKNAEKRGFTLIELLVAVLIIGVLVAVALPQYRTAALKSRVSADLWLLHGLKDAQERYFMQNGSYAEKFEVLDVSVPAPQKIVSDGGFLAGGWKGETAYWGEYKINILSGRGFIYAFRRLPDGKFLFYGFRLDHSPRWGASVLYASPSQAGKRVCRSLGVTPLAVDGSQTQYYGLVF